MWSPHLFPTRAPTRHWRRSRTSNRMGGIPQQLGRMWWGARAEEKWRQDGTSVPEGQLGEGRGSHVQRGNRRDHPEGRGSEGNVASISPANVGPGEPAEMPGLILCPWRFPLAVLSLSPAPIPSPRALPLHATLSDQLQPCWA